jgi:hypothetical protein
MPFHHAEALIVESDALRRTGAEGSEILEALRTATAIARRQGSLVQELRALDRLARGSRLAAEPTGQRWAAALASSAAHLSGEERAALLAGPVGGA